LLGDKRLLLNDRQTSFIMFGVEGRSWVALGDPVGGTPDEKQDLIWQFRDLCDQYAGWPVFYQVHADSLPFYVEAGMTLIKLGEEALVDLAAFSLEGKSQRAFRNVVNRFGKEAYAFAVVPPETTRALMPELRRVSDDWLQKKSVREKGFSLGYFDEAYLAHFSTAVVRAPDGGLVAFANLWTSEPKGELSIDLMRYSEAAPGGVMDFLFVQLMLWGKEQGYKDFNLGMAPLSGIENRTLAPFWAKMGAAIYRYGEHFYNFQGVREYKEKFGPRWEPKFLATRGSLALPVVMTNIASLISGGFRATLLK
jgi:phosphatidylglycerol lysyltransferase